MSLLQRKFGDKQSDRTAVAQDVGVGQRVRVGLTGLAAIFLLVLVAAAGLRPAQSLATPQPTDEPLAVLGVAPGAGSAVAVPTKTVKRAART